jgi:O-antigen/teichoic acid export membrane protein
LHETEPDVDAWDSSNEPPHRAFVLLSKGEFVTQRKSGALLSYLHLFVNTILGIVVISFLTRMLGQAEYGLYSIVGSFIATLAIMDMGLSNCVVRFVVKYRAKKDKESEASFIAVILVLYVIISVLAFLLGLYLRSYIPTMFKRSLTPAELSKANLMFIILFVNISFTLLFNSFRGIVAAYERFVFLSTADIIRPVLRIILLLVLLNIGYKVIAVVVVDTVCNILYSLAMAFYAFAILRVRVRFRRTCLTLLNPIFYYSVFILLNVIAGELYWRIGNIIVGVLTNSSLVAIYAVGSQVSLYYIMFSSNIANILGPKIVHAVDTGANGRELTDVMIKAGRMQGFVVALVLTGFVLFGRKFIALWVGAQYHDAYLVALFVMIPMTILLVQNLGIRILEAKGKHWVRSIIMFFMSLVNVLLAIVLVKRIGIIGASLGAAIGLLVGNVMLLNVYYHVAIGLDMLRFYKEISKGIIPATLISFCIGLGITLWQHASWRVLASQIFIYALAYCICLWFLGMNTYERNLCASMLRLQRPAFKTI